MNAPGETPLSTVPGWDRTLVEKLQGYWITTAEQVIGRTVDADSRRQIANVLGVSDQKLGHLLQAIKTALPAAKVEALNQKVDASRYGFGALPPPETT